MRRRYLCAALALAALGPLLGSPEAHADLFVSLTGSGTIGRVTPEGAVSSYGSGLGAAQGLALDGSGNLFVVCQFGDGVRKVAPDGTVTPFVSTPGLGDVVFGGDGDLYFAASDDTIRSVTPGGDESTFATGFDTPWGLAFDGDGDLFVSNLSTGTISEVTPDGTVTEFASGFARPFGIAFDGSGNLFVAEANAGTIAKIDQDGTRSVFASGLGELRGLAFDGTGNLYVADRTTNSVLKFTPDGAMSTFVSGLNAPTGLAFGPTAAVPEPSQLVLLGGVAVVAAGYSWRRRRPA